MKEDKEKKKYMPPKAVFVPIKLEEKLLTCSKLPSQDGKSLCVKSPGRAQ